MSCKLHIHYQPTLLPFFITALLAMIGGCTDTSVPPTDTTGWVTIDPNTPTQTTGYCGDKKLFGDRRVPQLKRIQKMINHKSLILTAAILCSCNSNYQSSSNTSYQPSSNTSYQSSSNTFESDADNAYNNYIRSYCKKASEQQCANGYTHIQRWHLRTKDEFVDRCTNLGLGNVCGQYCSFREVCYGRKLKSFYDQCWTECYFPGEQLFKKTTYYKQKYNNTTQHKSREDELRRIGEDIKNAEEETRKRKEERTKRWKEDNRAQLEKLELERKEKERISKLNCAELTYNQFKFLKSIKINNKNDCLCNCTNHYDSNIDDLVIVVTGTRAYAPVRSLIQCYNIDLLKQYPNSLYVQTCNSLCDDIIHKRSTPSPLCPSPKPGGSSQPMPQNSIHSVELNNNAKEQRPPALKPIRTITWKKKVGCLVFEDNNKRPCAVIVNSKYPILQDARYCIPFSGNDDDIKDSFAGSKVAQKYTDHKSCKNHQIVSNNTYCNGFFSEIIQEAKREHWVSFSDVCKQWSSTDPKISEYCNYLY